MTENSKNDPSSQCSTERVGLRMALGAGVGVAVGAGAGVAIGNIALGTGVGVALGAGIGMMLAMMKRQDMR